jgi:peroxiredoxin
MARVQLNTQAPAFTLEDFQGRPRSLRELHQDRHVVLVFNRGFT